jgi:hypothetical protein
MYASTARLQHGEQVRLPVALRAVALAGGVVQAKSGTWDNDHRNDLRKNTGKNRKGIASASAGYVAAFRKGRWTPSRQRFKPHTTILHHRSPLYEARVSLI